MSLVTEVWDFFSPLLIEQIVSESFAGAGVKAGMWILLWIDPTQHCNWKSKPGQHAMKKMWREMFALILPSV